MTLMKLFEFENFPIVFENNTCLICQRIDLSNLYLEYLMKCLEL